MATPGVSPPVDPPGDGAHPTVSVVSLNYNGRRYLERFLRSVLALAYPVPLLLLHPVMTDTAMMGYRWLFVLAITAAAVWLVLTVSRDAEALSPALSRLAARFRASAAARRARTDSLAVPTKPALRCPACGEVLPPGQTTCAKCGRQAAA